MERNVGGNLSLLDEQTGYAPTLNERYYPLSVSPLAAHDGRKRTPKVGDKKATN
jgi:hypothetical protein